MLRGKSRILDLKWVGRLC